MRSGRELLEQRSFYWWRRPEVAEPDLSIAGEYPKGTTIVISPLIALMHDQVQALEDKGIAATFLASTLSSDEARDRMRKMANGEYKLVYVTPERLTFSGAIWYKV